MSDLHFVTGDATKPQPLDSEFTCIAHICNDQGGWGAGFVLALTREFPVAEKCYREWYATREAEHSSYQPWELGQTQFVSVQRGIWVANMIAQHSYRSANNPVPVRYAHLETCLDQVREFACRPEIPMSVHMPRIGCGLAGGKWGEVEEIVRRALVNRGIDVVVYDLP